MEVNMKNGKGFKLIIGQRVESTRARPSYIAKLACSARPAQRPSLATQCHAARPDESLLGAA
jgi:hypothetical protein